MLLRCYLIRSQEKYRAFEAKIWEICADYALPKGFVLTNVFRIPQEFAITHPFDIRYEQSLPEGLMTFLVAMDLATKSSYYQRIAVSRLSLLPFVIDVQYAETETPLENVYSWLHMESARRSRKRHEDHDYARSHGSDLPLCGGHLREEY